MLLVLNVIVNNINVISIKNYKENIYINIYIQKKVNKKVSALIYIA